MLPFLEKKRTTDTILARRGEGLSVKSEVEAPSSEMDPDMKAAAEDLMRALENKSVLDVASALRAAIELCQMGDSE